MCVCLPRHPISGNGSHHMSGVAVAWAQLADYPVGCCSVGLVLSLELHIAAKAHALAIHESLYQNG